MSTHIKLSREELARAVHRYYCLYPGQDSHPIQQDEWDKADEILEILAKVGDQS